MAQGASISVESGYARDLGASMRIIAIPRLRRLRNRSIARSLVDSGNRIPRAAASSVARHRNHDAARWRAPGGARRHRARQRPSVRVNEGNAARVARQARGEGPVARQQVPHPSHRRSAWSRRRRSTCERRLRMRETGIPARSTMRGADRPAQNENAGTGRRFPGWSPTRAQVLRRRRAVRPINPAPSSINTPGSGTPFGSGAGVMGTGLPQALSLSLHPVPGSVVPGGQNCCARIPTTPKAASVRPKSGVVQENV